MASHEKITAVGIAGITWLWRENVYISSVVTCTCGVVGSEEDSDEAQCMCDVSLYQLSTMIYPDHGKSQQRRKLAVLKWWFTRNSCTLAMGFLEVAVLGPLALNAGFDNRVCLRCLSTFLRHLCLCIELSQHWMGSQSGAHDLSLPLLLSPCYSSHHLSSWCSQGLPDRGRDSPKGAGNLCACEWMCEAQVIWFALGSNFLGLGNVKQLKGLTLATSLPLAKPL